MRISKILKVGEFSAVNGKLPKNTRFYGVLKENISVQATEPLFESEPISKYLPAATDC